MKFNFVLADDKEEALISTSSYIERLLKKNNIEGRIMCSTRNPEEVLKYSRENHEKINVYILDINFQGEINGLWLARDIREREPYAYIIFLTAYIQHSMLIFKYRLKVFDFLVKPITYTDLEDCIIALQQDFNNISHYGMPSLKKTITLKSGYQDYQIDINEIIYIESFGPKLIIHMLDGQIETYGTLKDLENMLKSVTDVVFRCHKSYIINLDHIKKADILKQEVIMSNGEMCLISRAHKKYLKEYIDERVKKV